MLICYNCDVRHRYTVWISLHNVALASGSLDFECHVALSHDIVDILFSTDEDKSCGVNSSITICLSHDRPSTTFVCCSISANVTYDTQSYLKY